VESRNAVRRITCIIAAPKTNYVSENNRIAFSDAIEMTKRFRNNREEILDIDERGKDILALNETFDKADIEQLMQQQDCTGFRIYYGMDTNLKVHAILVGVDNNGADILPEAVYNGQPGTVTNSGELLEDAIRCPPACPPASPLNQD
jgi:hypothetical protein